MDGTARTISSVYDAGSRRTHVGATSGYQMNFGYDAADNMTSLYDGNNETIVQFGYDSAGRRQTLALGPGGSSPVSYGYDPVGRLSSLSHNIAATPGYQALTFGYNPAGQMVTRTSSNDAFASNTAYNVNRGYSVNGLNQYTAAGGATFAYDTNGNLTSDGTNTYLYDAENRLVSRSGGVSLAYDPNGRLWQLSAPTGTTRFEYDGDRLLEEFNTAGTWQRLYAWGPGVDEPLVWYEMTGGAMRRFLHADHQGSVIAVTDDAGNPLSINGYDAWGIPNAANGGRFQYTGQAWLGELGLYYYKARIYSPTLGRFLQTDPVGYKDQVNLYAYVGNDPVDGRDPTGLYDCTGSRLCGGFRRDQDAAKEQLAGRIRVLRGLARDVSANRRLSGVERQAQATMDKFLGAGAGHNLSSINGLISAANSMMDVLNSHAPIVPTGRQEGSAYARTRGGAESPVPTLLFPRYFAASDNTRRETLPHEASHRALGTHDWAYGEKRAAQFAITHPDATMRSADNVVFALGFTRDDD